VPYQQCEFALLYRLIRQLLQLVFEDGHALLHPLDPWLKFHLFNQAFRIAIN
jgi:hypothetical protein